MQIGVFHRELCLLLPNAVVLEFGIKIGIETEFVVKKFLIAKQWNVRPYRFQEQGLAPTGMGTDQIGRETPVLELLSCTGTALSTNHLGFSFHDQGMNTFGGAAIKAVTEVVEALGNAMLPVEGIDTQGHQLVLSLLGKALSDMKILARKILMNEENSH